jgi:hypothetical protein
MTILLEINPGSESYSLFPRIVSGFFWFLSLLVILGDVRALIRYNRVVAKVVAVDAVEETMHDMAGAVNVQHVPEIEFLSVENEKVRMKVYESLLKSYSPGKSITVYYRKTKRNGEYKLYFPFSRLKFVLILLFSSAAFFLWKAAAW